MSNKEMENKAKEQEVSVADGYKKIEKFDAVATDAVRIRITDSRVCPILSFVGVY